MAGNACLKCTYKFFRALPVVFILLITFWSYYAYVVVFCIQFVTSIVGTVFYILFYHLFIVLFLWSFMKTVVSKPIRPPHEFHLSIDDWDQLHALQDEQEKNKRLESIIATRKLPIETTNDIGLIRICTSCSLIKPDRCHHCSSCECCLLKMDHHCPWIDNCVGFHNYKFFVIFLSWGFLYCLYIVSTTAAYFVEFWQNLHSIPPTRYNFLFLFFVAIMFGFAQAILLICHIYLVCRNRTTMEGLRSPTFRETGVDKQGFNVGWRKNLKEVFGDNIGLAFLPVFTSLGTGYQWRRRGHKGFTYQSLE